jgi:hypothetical protein
MEAGAKIFVGWIAQNEEICDLVTREIKGDYVQQTQLARCGQIAQPRAAQRLISGWAPSKDDSLFQTGPRLIGRAVLGMGLLQCSTLKCSAAQDAKRSGAGATGRLGIAAKA